MYNKKGQGAIEYLLIIGGVLIVATIVVAIIISSGQRAGESTVTNIDTYNNLIDSTIVPPQFLNIRKQIEHGGIACYFTFNNSPTSGVTNYYFIGSNEVLKDITLPIKRTNPCTCDEGEDVYVVAEKNGNYSIPSNALKCPADP